MKSVPSLLFFKPMKEEPTVFPFGPIAEMIVVPKQPYRPGEKCYMREAWAIDGWIGETVFLKIAGTSLSKTAPDEFIQQLWEEERLCFAGGAKHKNPFRQRSSISMPAWVARRFVTIVSCEPMRVEKVTDEDCMKLGFVPPQIPMALGPDGWYETASLDHDCYKRPSELFLIDWLEKHPGKEWAWRIESKEDSCLT